MGDGIQKIFSRTFIFDPLQFPLRPDFDLPYDATIGDGSLNTNSDSLNDTYADVHFQQREYDHDGGQSDVMFNIDPDNHFHASISTNAKRKGGGVALYVHRRFNCAIRAVKCKVVEQLFECVTVELDLKKHKNITVSCVYRTPGSDVA